MNKKYLIIICLVLAASFLFSDVQELPDVEISGPSILKSILEKRGLDLSELLIPDIADSIKPILPQIPFEDKIPVKQKNYALYCELSNMLNGSVNFIADNLFSSPYSFNANINRTVLKKEWNSLDVQLGFMYLLSHSKFGIKYKTINTESPYLDNKQYVNAVNLNYYINNIKALNTTFNFYINPEIQDTQNKYMISDLESARFVNNAGFNFKLKNKYLIGVDANYAYHSPLISLSAANEQDDNDYDFLRSLSVHASDKRFVPGVHLSKRYFLDSQNQIHLYQNSSVKIWDNYRLIKEQPWQLLQDNALVSFNPVNAHIVLTNKPPFNPKFPILISADCFGQYYIDEPVYLSTLTNNLPKAEEENVIKGGFDVSVVLKTPEIKLEQSIEVKKGFLAAQIDKELPYLPLLSVKSAFKYQMNSFSCEAYFNQYYLTKDELGTYLRESFDLGAQLGYMINADFSLYAKASNLLNRGLYSYRTIPTEPAKASIGFLYSF